MARVDVTQDVVLERIVARLRSELDLNERRCYEVLDPMAPPAVPVGGEYFVSVALGDGTFVSGEQVSGNVTEETTVTVTVYTRTALDSPDRDKYLLRESRRGLLVRKKSILAALVGYDLNTEDDDSFLRTLLEARRAEPPTIVERNTGDGGVYLGVLRMEFACDFDWDLT